MLTLEGDSPAYRQIGMQVIDNQCVARGAQFRFNWPLFRGGLFEAIYLRDFAAGAAPSLEGVAPLAYVGGGAYMNLQDRARNTAILHVAELRGSGRPRRRSRLARQCGRQPGGGCDPRADRTAPRVVHAEGAPTGFRRPILRGLVAEALYRLSFAARHAGGH